MTHDEAVALLKILATADGGCETCVRSLFTKATAVFPPFQFTMESDRDWYQRPRRAWLNEEEIVIEEEL